MAFFNFWISSFIWRISCFNCAISSSSLSNRSCGDSICSLSIILDRLSLVNSKFPCSGAHGPRPTGAIGGHFVGRHDHMPPPGIRWHHRQNVRRGGRRGVKKTCRWHIFSVDLSGYAAVASILVCTALSFSLRSRRLCRRSIHLVFEGTILCRRADVGIGPYAATIDNHSVGGDAHIAQHNKCWHHR